MSGWGMAAAYSAGPTPSASAATTALSSSALVRIGPYRLSKTLGIGSFGKVKLAIHEKTSFKVAIKILNRMKIRKLDMQEKVRREIANLKRFSHPHIIRLYEVIHTPSDIFVVMEYVSGGELFDYIVQKGRLTEAEARHYFQQIIAGVEYCHYHHVVHRDLKPENLLLDADHNVKIADFGLSNCMDDGNFLRTSCGSPNYAAPEVISGLLYAGPEVDVWSCGVILYALLVGSLPFDDESIANLFKKIKSGLFTLPAFLSEFSRDLIPRMLEVDPLRRITIPEIRKHPWFRTKLPLYLSVSPATAGAAVEAALAARAYKRRLGLVRGMPSRDSLLSTSASSLNTADAAAARESLGFSSELDAEVLDETWRLYFTLTPGAPPSVPLSEVERLVRLSGKHGNRWNEIGVAYHILNERKRARQRAAQIEEAHKSTVAATVDAVGVFAAAAAALSIPGFSPEEQNAAFTAMQAASAARRRRWYLGIQSKKDPAHVMGEVFRALRDAGFEWKTMGPYRIRARFSHTLLMGAAEAARGVLTARAEDACLGCEPGDTSEGEGEAEGSPGGGSYARGGYGGGVVGDSEASSSSGMVVDASVDASGGGSGHEASGSGSTRSQQQHGGVSGSSDIGDGDIDLTGAATATTTTTTPAYTHTRGSSSHSGGGAIASSLAPGSTRSSRSRVSSSGGLHGGGGGGGSTRVRRSSEGGAPTSRSLPAALAQAVEADAQGIANGYRCLADVKVGLQLYKVQRGIYLLDLQKLGGDAFSFMNLCARIITELKVPAAAASAVATAAAASAGTTPGGSGGSGGGGTSAGTPSGGSAPPPGLTSAPPAGLSGTVAHVAAPASRGGTQPPQQSLQVMAVPSTTPGAPPTLYCLNPSTNAPEPLPPQLYHQAMMQLQASGQLPPGPIPPQPPS